MRFREIKKDEAKDSSWSFPRSIPTRSPLGVNGGRSRQVKIQVAGKKVRAKVSVPLVMLEYARAKQKQETNMGEIFLMR